MAAVGTRFWCPLNYRTRVINAPSSQYKGSPYNVLDYNPDSTYIATNKPICGLQFDFDASNDYASSVVVTFAAAFARNTHGYSYPLRFQIWRSNDYNSWGSAVGYLANITDAYYFPLVIEDLAVSMARYWKIDLWSDNGETVECGGLMLGRYHDLDVRWNWGSPQGDGYFNHGLTNFSGRQSIRIGNDNGVFTAERHYEYLTTTQMNAIRAAWADTRGGAYPMIITDDLPSSTWSATNPNANARNSYLARFNHPADADGKKRLGEVEVQSGLWNVTLYLSEVPWAGEGEIV